MISPIRSGWRQDSTKNGEAVDAILRLGFGFVEAGTVTPLPQPGNSRPRIFRLPRDSAIINRLGFNSLGHAFAHEQLAARRGRGGLVAVNLGANKESRDRVMDYVEGVKAFADVADFFVINISSPNTPGLRDLQNQSALNVLLANVFAAREMAPRRVPIVVKIAPDLTLDELDGIVEVCKSCRVDGLAISNTTLSRPENLADYQIAAQQGGLSGRPLFHLSTWLLAHAFLRVEGAFPLIGNRRRRECRHRARQDRSGRRSRRALFGFHLQRHRHRGGHQARIAGAAYKRGRR